MGAPVYRISPALSVNAISYDITEGTWKFDPELHEILSTTSFFSAFTLGNLKASFTIKTHDSALADLYFKGAEATDVLLTYKKAPLAPDAEMENHTFAAGTVGWKLSNCRVTEGVDQPGTADKKPGEYTITFAAARKSSDNSDPTITKITA
jgi:hypothetical protein